MHLLLNYEINWMGFFTDFKVWLYICLKIGLFASSMAFWKLISYVSKLCAIRI